MMDTKNNNDYYGPGVNVHLRHDWKENGICSKCGMDREWIGYFGQACSEEARERHQAHLERMKEINDITKNDPNVRKALEESLKEMGNLQPDPDVKFEINNLLWVHLHEDTTLKRADEIAAKIYNLIVETYDGRE